MAEDMNATTGEGAPGAGAGVPASTATEPAAGDPTGSLPGGAKTDGSSEPANAGSRAQPDSNAGSEEPPKEAPGKGLLSEEDDEDETADPNGVLGAPEKGYEFKDSPESEVHFDGETRSAFAAVAKELNLSQEAAQKVIDKMEPALVRRVEALRKEWAQASQTDAEFGGQNFKQNVKAIRRTYLQTTTPELRAAFEASGLDSNPEVLRHFYRLSKVLSDGKFVTSQGTRDDGVGSEHRFYKGMNP